MVTIDSNGAMGGGFGGIGGGIGAGYGGVEFDQGIGGFGQY